MKLSVSRAAIVALLTLATGCLQTNFQVPVNVSDQNLKAEAEKGKPAAWKLPLGAGRIDDMAFHSPGRLLVSLRKNQSVAGDQYAMLVDTATGRPLWRYEPADRKGEYSRILTARDVIFYSFNHKDKVTLVAVSSKDGPNAGRRLKWKGRFNSVRSPTRAWFWRPVPVRERRRSSLTNSTPARHGGNASFPCPRKALHRQRL